MGFSGTTMPVWRVDIVSEVGDAADDDGNYEPEHGQHGAWSILVIIGRIARMQGAT